MGGGEQGGVGEGGGGPGRHLQDGLRLRLRGAGRLAGPRGALAALGITAVRAGGGWEGAAGTPGLKNKSTHYSINLTAKGI